MATRLLLTVRHGASWGATRLRRRFERRRERYGGLRVDVRDIIDAVLRDKGHPSVDLVAGSLDVKPIIGGTWPISDWQEAFEKMHSGEVVKSILKP